nr:hypothetical protein D3W47_12085 [Deinococcus sp. RM]
MKHTSTLLFELSNGAMFTVSFCPFTVEPYARYVGVPLLRVILRSCPIPYPCVALPVTKLRFALRVSVMLAAVAGAYPIPECVAVMQYSTRSFGLALMLTVSSVPFG